MQRQKFWGWPFLLLAWLVACAPQSPITVSPLTGTPDLVATGAAQVRAIAATLTAEFPTSSPTALPSATANKIATGVAEARAIAATLTAEVVPGDASNPPVTATLAPQATLRSVTGSEKIYFSAGTTLFRLNLDGSEFENVAEIGINENFVIDSTRGKIYISRWDASSQISVFDVQTKETSAFSDGPGPGGGQGLAVDPTNAKLFLGLYYNGVYGLDMLDDRGWTQLVTRASLSPMLGQRGQLELDAANRHIYFRASFNGDCGECRYIWRVDFDGQNLVKIIRANAGDAMALDLTAGKLYFSDMPGHSTLKRANLDGSNPETVLTLPEPYHYCWRVVLDVAQQKMYFSLFNEDNGFKDRAIARANMDGTDFEILYKMTGNTPEEVAGGIALYLP